METYHKISTPFKRYFEGPRKGQLMIGNWATPEFEYLANNPWDFTEKVDGTNIRIGYEDILSGRPTGVAVAGRSNNATIPAPLLEYLKSTFTVERFRAAAFESITLFGEGYGPKIQGGGKYRDDHSFVLFDVKIGDLWLDRENVNDVANQLNIDSVPVLGTGTLYDAIELVSHPEVQTGLETFMKAGLESAWGNFEAEGIIARPAVPMFNRKGERIITKIKSKDFK